MFCNCNGDPDKPLYTVYKSVPDSTQIVYAVASNSYPQYRSTPRLCAYTHFVFSLYTNEMYIMKSICQLYKYDVMLRDVLVDLIQAGDIVGIFPPCWCAY